jgi:hypothetical protein
MHTRSPSCGSYNMHVQALLYYKYALQPSCRALHVLKLKQAPFLAAEGQQPDLYGPVWACTSLVFLLAVVGNIAAWEHSKPPDIRIIMTALGLVYGYVLVGGGALFGASKWLGLGIGLVRAISLYGA